MDVLVSRLNALGAENALRQCGAGKMVPSVGKGPSKRSGTCSPPVVLTKADLEKLRCHADLPPVADAPRDCRLGAGGVTGSQAALQPKRIGRARSTGSNVGPFAQKEPRACSATPEPRERPPRPPRLSRNSQGAAQGAALRAAGAQTTSGEPGRHALKRDGSNAVNVKHGEKGKLGQGSLGHGDGRGDGKGLGQPPPIGPFSFELCGVDPRRGAAAGGAPSSSSAAAPGASLDVRRESPTQALLNAVDGPPQGLSIMGQPMVNGSGLTIATFEDPTEDEGDREPIYLPWSESEDEGLQTVSDTEWDYREYRYRMPGKEVPDAAVLQPNRGRSVPRRPRPERKEEEDKGNSSDLDSPWTRRRIVSTAWGLGTEREDSPPGDVDGDMDPEMLRVCKAVAQFYGLPDQELKTNFNVLYGNCLSVDDEAWGQRARSGDQPMEVPYLWIRGGRVYDFHGDRGTVDEVENDFLVRQIDYDENCRLRRKEQGLMPYPFVPIPLRHEPGMDPEQRSELRRQQEKAQGEDQPREPRGRAPRLPSK